MNRSPHSHMYEDEVPEDRYVLDQATFDDQVISYDELQLEARKTIVEVLDEIAEEMLDLVDHARNDGPSIEDHDWLDDEHMQDDCELLEIDGHCFEDDALFNLVDRLNLYRDTWANTVLWLRTSDFPQDLREYLEDVNTLWNQATILIDGHLRILHHECPWTGNRPRAIIEQLYELRPESRAIKSDGDIDKDVLNFVQDITALLDKFILVMQKLWPYCLFSKDALGQYSLEKLEDFEEGL